MAKESTIHRWALLQADLHCTGLVPARRQAITRITFNLLHGLKRSKLKFHSKCVIRQYCDVIMGAMASQITSLTIVYSIVHSVADQRKHQSSASLAIVRGIHRGAQRTSNAENVSISRRHHMQSPKRCPFCSVFNVLTHWGRVTHICVGKLTIIGSDNDLSPGRRQAIIWTNAGILFIEPLGTNVSEIFIGIKIFSFKKMHLKMSSANGVHFVSASMC